MRIVHRDYESWYLKVEFYHHLVTRQDSVTGSDLCNHSICAL